MTSRRLPARDPRTVARDIPGICDALFPQLAPGVVMHFNRDASSDEGCETVPQELIAESRLQHAMLFELAVAAGEQLMNGDTIDWDASLALAVRRQRRHFDAKLPSSISEVDKEVATLVATNLATMLTHISLGSDEAPILRAPHIPGYQWIASGRGDFSVGTTLIEVKCTNRSFSSSDYRQIMMYWLLSYAASVEGGAPEWSDALLINPRLNMIVEVSFDEVIQVVSAGRTKVELLELFASMVADHTLKAHG